MRTSIRVHTNNDRGLRINHLIGIATIVLTIAGLLTALILSKAPGTYGIRFNSFAVLSGISCLVNIGLAFYLIRKPSRSDERIWLTAYTLTFVVFTLGEMMQRLSATVTGAIWWHNVEAMGVLLGPMLYLFVLAYTNKSERRYSGTLALALIASPMLTLYFNMTDLIFPHAASAWLIRPWGWDYNIHALGFGIWLDFFWFNGFLIASLERLLNFYRHNSNPLLRRQAIFIALAACTPFILGTGTDIVLPFFGINIPPLALAIETMGGAFLIFAATRYQLLTLSPTQFSGTVLSTVAESVIVTDPQFNVIFMNSRAEELLGAKTGERAIHLLDHLAKQSVVPFQQAFAEAAMASTTNLTEVGITRPHSDPVPVRLSSSPLNIGDYHVHVMILTDITDELHIRKRIEHEVHVRTGQLREARAYLISSINSIEQGFVLVNKDAHIELANTAASQLWQTRNLNSSEEDASSTALVDLPKLDWNIDLPAAVQRSLETKHPRHLSAVRASGSFYEVYVTPVVQGEHTLGAAIVVEDVTEAKILDRSKDEFFSIASHELRTPLTAIRGNMGMVKDYFPDAMKDDSLRSMIDDTHAASVRLIEIVNDFLDSSSLEQGKMQFNIQPVKVAPLVQSVVTDLKPILEGQHDTVTLEKLDHLPAVAADEARLRQILYNLLNNAAKYSEHATITISGEADGKLLKLRVTDTGKGISPENQKLLFHKFQQAGESILTRDNTKGTGLGLYISRLLATNMHGNVELEHTEVGKGSTFMLTLPRASSGAPERADAHHAVAT